MEKCWYKYRDDYGYREKYSGSNTTNIVQKNTLIIGVNSNINLSLKTSKTYENENKLPVSLLQEIAMRHGLIPMYELTRFDKNASKPIFQYRVFITLHDGHKIFSIAKGRSKNDAKHAAANLMIKQLSNLPTFNTNATIKNVTQCISGDTVDSGKDIEKTPVQLLQEYTINKHLFLPIYKLTKEFGPAHAKQFIISCNMQNLYVYGQGKSKKLAKQEAAYKMWTKLNESDSRISGTEITSDLYNESRMSELQTKLDSNLHIASKEKKVEFTKSLQAKEYGASQLLRTKITSDLNNESELQTKLDSNLHNASKGKKVKFTRNLQTKEYGALQLLEIINLPDPKWDYIKLLEQVSKEKNFEIRFVNMEKELRSNNYECTAIWAIKSGLFFNGRGIDRNEAKRNVALAVLQYIKENLYNNLF